MRKILLPILLSTLAAPAATGQIFNTGLVADWRFSGNALDSSGNAHNGTPTGITYTAGRSGIPNTAAVFNTPTSFISVPYAADLNVVNYSMCAILKPTAFNTGPCQASTILERMRSTTSPSSGFYNLFYTDNAFDNGNCSAFDTSFYIFGAITGGNTPSAQSAQYTPTIRTNQWTSVVATFNGSVTRIYTNGVLRATMPTPSPIGTNLEGLGIGTAPAQPSYKFTGLLDDLRLYNRVLTDSEITIYHNPPVSTGIADVAENDATEIVVSPNPATTSLTIGLADPVSTAFTVVDGLGRSVIAGTLANKENKLDITSLTPGVYFIRATSNTGSSVKQFIKK